MTDDTGSSIAKDALRSLAQQLSILLGDKLTLERFHKIVENALEFVMIPKPVSCPQIDQLPEGGSFTLICRNVVGILWERVYRKHAGNIEAITIGGGSYGNWRQVENPAEDVRRTQELIDKVRNEDRVTACN